jgi:ribosome recycling factor
MADDLESLILDDMSAAMEKSVVHTKHEFASIRTGRASPTLVEKMVVDYYGQGVPMQQLAGFSVPEARQLLIAPYDKESVTAIEKAIRESDLGLNPSNDGNTIRLSFPPLTEERRRDLVKVVRQMAEDGRVALRNERRAGRHELEQLKKDGDISDDDLARAEKQLDTMIHRAEAQIGVALVAKEEELLEVG